MRRLTLLFTISCILAAIGIGTYYFQTTDHQARAIDCPSIALKNVQGSFTGMEILSNTAPFQRGVRLNWKNPNEPKPQSITILRKEPHEDFRSIATISGTSETYLDTQIEKRKASYYYALKNTYICGGTNISSYIEVPLFIDRDQSEPRATFINKEDETQGKEDPVIFLLKDAESGIDTTTLKITDQENRQFSGGKFYGFAHRLLWIYYPTKSFWSTSTEETIDLSVSNLAGLTLATQDTTHSLKLQDQTNIVRFSQPTPNGVFNQNLKLSLAWRPKTIPTEGNYLLESSVDLGATWNTVDTMSSKTSTYSIDNPLSKIQGLSTAAKDSLVLFRVTLLDKDGAKIAFDILPLERGTIKMTVESSQNTIFVPNGSIKIFDAYSGKQIAWPISNESMTDFTKNWKFGDQVQSMSMEHMSGYYMIKMTSSTYTFPAYHALGHEDIYLFTSTSQDIKLYSDPSIYYDTNREEPSEESVAVVTNVLEPGSKFPYTFPALPDTSTTNSNLNSNAANIPTVDTPFELTTSHCSRGTFTCKDSTYTAIGVSISMFYDPLKDEFYSSNSTTTETEKSLIGIPVQEKKYHFYVSNTPYHIDIPAEALLLSKGQSIQLFTLERRKDAYRVIIPQGADALFKTSSSFATFSSSNSCNKIFTSIVGKSSSPYYSVCKNNGDLSVITQQGDGVTLQNSIKQNIPKSSSGSWFTPYMNSFNDSKLFYNTEDYNHPNDGLTRGELAFFIVNALHLPLSSNAHTFSDLPEQHPFSTAISTLQAAGIMEGELASDGTKFVSPDRVVRRAEALKLILKSTRVTEKNTKTLLTPIAPFTDIRVDDWFYTYIDLAYTNNIVNGYTLPDGSKVFRPGQSVSRAEAIKMIISCITSKIQ